MLLSYDIHIPTVIAIGTWYKVYAHVCSDTWSCTIIIYNINRIIFFCTVQRWCEDTMLYGFNAITFRFQNYSKKKKKIKKIVSRVNVRGSKLYGFPSDDPPNVWSVACGMAVSDRALRYDILWWCLDHLGLYNAVDRQHTYARSPIVYDTYHYGQNIIIS